jgi:uncharacterized RDD family membrane protein YckC
VKASERPPSPAPEGPPLLFDLPLEPPPPVEPTKAATAARVRTGQREGAGRRLPLFDAPGPERSARDRAPQRAGPARIEDDEARDPAPRDEAPLARRLIAGLADLAILFAWTALVGGAAAALTRSAPAGALVPVACLGLLFSFVYTVLPLALWRRTAGMALAGLTVSTERRGAISLAQGAGRWVGGLVTMAGGGLPAALLVTGRSLGDRLSGSRVEWLADRRSASEP